MTNYLQEVLNIAPSTWTGNNYDNCNYVVIEVDSSSDEYEEIENDLRSENVSFSQSIAKIERVQHPFAYGRYILRKEQFIKRDGSANYEERFFLLVPKDGVPITLEYNLDKRRKSYEQLSSYSPRSSDYCVVVAKSLRPLYSVDRDCDMYPEYVVYYDD